MAAELETVVARATPEGEGGLAVVRLSGPGAMTIAGRVFRGPGFAAAAPGAAPSPRPRRAVYGILHEPIDSQDDAEKSLAVIDEVLALPLPGPHSYTGEDTVEFFCHGGRQVAAAVVRACQTAGAVTAPPGEFTRRAFLHGRLSLDQAEAVADLIQAGSEQAARAAVAQLRGGLDAELGALEWPLLDLLIRLEGSLEFSDDDDEAAVSVGEIRLVLTEALDGVAQLLDLAPAGRLLREGVHVALAGAPNAGKSSLFNRLVGSDRALVDAEPGTTRDIVTANVRRGGRLYVLHDTAGLRDAAGRVESMGIARARETAAEADLVLLLAAAESGGARTEWPAVGGEAGTCAGASGGAIGGTSAGILPPTLFVLTKCDLIPGASAGANAGADGDMGKDAGAGAATCAGASNERPSNERPSNERPSGEPTSGEPTSGEPTSGAPTSGARAPSGPTAAAAAPDIIATSSLTGAGVEDLWAAIEHQVTAWRLDEAVSLGVVLNERHRQRLLETRDELSQLLALYEGAAAPGAEVAGTLLASLLARLGEISGRVFTEQMLDGIFKRFCVGK